MEQNKKTKRTSIYFPPDLLAKVEQSAKIHRRSFNQQVLWHVEHSIATQEKTPDQAPTRSGVVKA
jgi:hypothetical protein